jgi:hypothetical protein
VAWQLGRLAESVEGSITAAGRVVAASTRLSQDLDRVVALARPAWAGAGSGAVHRPLAPASLLTALALGVVALALAFGNAWFLARLLVPALDETGTIALGGISPVWVAAGFSGLAVALGLAHFAVFNTAPTLTLRVAGSLAGILLVVQGGLQAAATAVAVQTWSGVVTGSWAGIAALILVAGAVGLMPVLIGVTVYAGMDGLARWSRARAQRAADRLGGSYDRLVARMERSLRSLSDRMATLRTEAAVVPEGDVARLLLQPTPAVSVERLALVLRRLAVSAERDPGLERAAGRAAVLRRVGDLGAFTAWALVAVGLLSLLWPTWSVGAESEWPGAVVAAALAGSMAALFGGLALRLLLERPGRLRDPRIAGAALVLLGIVAGSAALTLGPLVAAAPPLAGDPLGAAALLNLLLLVGALASARLPEGVRAAVDLLRLVTGAVTWTVLSMLDAALAATDRALVGRRTGRATHRPRGPARPAVGTLGGAPPER